MNEQAGGLPQPKVPDEGIEIPDSLPVLVLPNHVVFPMAIVPLHVTAKPELMLIDDVGMGGKIVALVGCKTKEGQSATVRDAYRVGCIGRILQLQHLPDESQNVVVQSLKRFKLLEVLREEPYPVARVQLLEEPPLADAETVTALANAVKQQMARIIALSPNIPEGANALLESIEEPGFLADLVAGNLGLSVEERQGILEALDRKERLQRLTRLLAREAEILEMSNKIQQDVKSSIDKGQREFFLRQQLNAIKRELGEDDETQHVQEYRKKIEALGLPEEAKKEALRELDRLASMNEASAEFHVVRTYLDWIVDLPWSVSTKDRLDIARAEAILNEDHYGLDKVKRRILEYLAVRKLRPDAAGPILCFVGPPGVGKTSLGKSIARALDRKFTRISLGGVRDEAEIRGHRKTYVGALPGRIIQNLRKVQSNNPVFMLDEVDKIGADFRGDPSSALLEVLDPAQNNSFSDHYLNVAFDLSKVMFIATANILDTIPWALRDRMEVIEIPGYIVEEKLHIARKYLVPRQIEAHGIPSGKLRFSTAALRKIIESYTREAGVRNLEREIANVCRGTARKFAEGRRQSISVGPQGLREYLGNERAYSEVAERTRVPGVATGMAWTPTGGGILFIEAASMPGKGNLILTGQLGDVMKESAQAVLSYVRSNANALGIRSDGFTDKDIHVHVPAGAVPKDGPSAGVTILAAVTSLLTGKRVKSGLAMTGEITLRGLVLPVGGIKEKVLAAVAAGIKEIILPVRCKNDLDDVPPTAKKKVKFHFVTRMEEVLTIALGLKT